MRADAARVQTLSFHETEQRSGPHDGRPNIVLIHGAWADGRWSGVIERLQVEGFQVRRRSSR